MKSIFAFLFCIAFSLQSSYAAYSGRVFVDKNVSGNLDKEVIPLKDVVVTDGQNTVKTGKDGKFTLPGYEKTRFITLTTPAGYQIEKQYIPVNGSVKSYDFILTPNSRTSKNNHSFIQITDTEIHGRGVGENWAHYLKEYVQNEQVAFLIHTGDICYENGLKNHIQVVNSETMGCPVYYGIGNHDLVKGEYGEQLYESIYGPCWYSFDVGNVHYVMTPMAGGDYKPSYTKMEVYKWLKNDLTMMSPEKQLVVFNHDIMTTKDDFIWSASETDQVDLRQHNLKAWVYGHFHINYVRDQKGIYTVCTATLDKGGIDHSPSAFRVFRLGKDKIVDMNLHYCSVDHQTVIASPADGQKAALVESGKIPLSVNAYYSGGEVKQVSYAFRNNVQSSFSTPQKMHQETDWNWYAEFAPGNISANQPIEVEVTTQFSDGKTTVTHSQFTCDRASNIAIKMGENWTNLLKNTAHTGNLSAQLKSPLQLAWVKNVGANIFMTSPLIVNNRIFIASIDDSNLKNQALYALDSQTGKVLWKYPTRNSIKNSIAYDRQTVFAQDANGYLYAVDATSGSLKWEKQLDPASFPYVEEGLIAENGIVYAGTGKGLGAYRCNDGTAVWVNTAWSKNEGATTTLTLGNNVLTAGAQWGALYGNNAQTGELLWKLSKDGLSDRGASTTLYEGKFYVISRSSLFVIDPQTGEIVKQKEFPEFNLNVTSTPLITDTEIIFGTADKGLIALDKQNLGIKWNVSIDKALVYTSPYTTALSATIETSPVASQGIVYFGASDGYLYGLNAKTGEIAWKYATGSPIFASVAMSGNALVAADFSGNVYTFVSDLN